MAEKPRFRVPTLEEMEKADQQEALISRRTLFKRDGSSKAAGTSADMDNTDSPKAKGSPRKHVMSQKALLSRMPLSRQMPPRKNTVSSDKAVTRSSEQTEITALNKVSNSTRDLSTRHHVSQVSSDQSKPKQPHATLTGPASFPAKEITSSWTGNTLGGDSRNAQQQRPAASSTASALKNSAASSSTSPVEETGSGGVNTSEGTSEDQQESVRADVLPTLAKLGKTNSLVVNQRQRGNPILKFVRNVPWEFGSIVPDYVMGQSNCALYLSLRYHQLHPEYIHHRLKQLGRSFDLRVLLVQVDIKDPHHLLKDLAKVCILADCTLMVAFSAEEAGRYLETYKVYENKAAEALMERTDSDFGIQLSDCLTRVKAVNKTDCSTLLATFGDLQGIMEASSEDLSLCPGFGPQKAKRLHDVFREPFLVTKKHRAKAADTE